MRAGVVALLILAGVAAAQEPPASPPLVVPPAADIGAVPNGTPVSQPLTPSTPLPAPGPGPAPLAEAEIPVRPSGGPLGHSWSKYELLFWWPKAHPLPPLVTASPPGTTPALGGPTTRVLIGGQSLEANEAAGLRLTTGWSATTDDRAGVEISYFFLGTRTYHDQATDLGGTRVLGRPVVNPVTGAETVVPVATPGVGSGLVSVTTSSRVTGWEVGGVGNLYSLDGFRLNVTAGYRYFQLNEGLRVEQTSLLFPLPNRPQILLATADQIDAHNRFHGGQVGFQSQFSRGPVFVEVSGSVALGRTIEVAKASGQTVAITAGFPLSLVQPIQAGVLGPPNGGTRATRSAFSYLPDGRLKVGYKLNDGCVFYVGYNFVYLSEAIRPGDQVNRAVPLDRLTQLAAVADPLGLLAQGNGPPPRPAATDAWVQGLLFGVEYRY